MISLEKCKILTPLQKLPKNVGDLGKLIIAKGFEKLPKAQKSPNLVTLIDGRMSLTVAVKESLILITNLPQNIHLL